jgi:O-6-methylguanine DNA methyltransferase
MEKSFAAKVYEAVRKIPSGKVMTYGDIAFLLGAPGACRAVGNALHQNPSYRKTPCYRVVDSQGRLSPQYAFGGLPGQERLLRAEGVEVQDGKVDLKKYRFSEKR